MKYTIHPEVVGAIHQEYLRLDAKHPTILSEYKLNAAMKMVRAYQLAVTTIFHTEHMAVR